jgi:hypothetical protein
MPGTSNSGTSTSGNGGVAREVTEAGATPMAVKWFSVKKLIGFERGPRLGLSSEGIALRRSPSASWSRPK